MSDWLPNIIDLFGKKCELEKFKNEVAGIAAYGEETVFTFTKIIPIPEEFSESKDLDRHINWLREHWGTRNDAIYPKIDIADDCLSYSFLTVNSQPFPIFSAIIDRYPELDFRIQFWPELCEDTYFLIKTKKGKQTIEVHQ